jgi:hypothetical protein
MLDQKRYAFLIIAEDSGDPPLAAFANVQVIVDGGNLSTTVRQHPATTHAIALSTEDVLFY